MRPIGVLMGTSEDLKIDSYRTRREVPDWQNQRLIIPTRNLVIASLPLAESNELVSATQAVHLKLRDVIYEGGDEIEYAYFPIDCVVSSLAILEDGSTVEIAMAGREGMVGIPALIGGGRAVHWTSVSVAGAALKVSIAALEQQANKHEALHSAILR